MGNVFQQLQYDTYVDWMEYQEIYRELAPSKDSLHEANYITPNKDRCCSGDPKEIKSNE